MTVTHAIDASVVVAILVNKHSSAGGLIFGSPQGVITLVETDPNLPRENVVALLEQWETCGSTVHFFSRRGAPVTSPSIQTEFMETGDWSKSLAFALGTHSARKWGRFKGSVSQHCRICYK